MLLVDFSSSADAGRYAAAYSQETGFPKDAVADMLHKPVNFGAMMVGRGDTDAMVAGLSHATEDVILASQMFVGMAEGVSIPFELLHNAGPGLEWGRTGTARLRGLRCRAQSELPTTGRNRNRYRFECGRPPLVGRPE